MNEDFAAKVVTVVDRHGPIKAIDLPIKLVEEFGSEAFHEYAEINDFLDLIETLIERRRLIEVEYFLPGLDRAKSILFPALTEIRIRGED